MMANYMGRTMQTARLMLITSYLGKQYWNWTTCIADFALGFGSNPPDV
jgi:hypothetical protein